MEFQILRAFPIQSQPRLDVCIFGISCSGVCISLLDLAGAFAIDLRQHWLKRHTENGSLRPAPAAPVAQRLCKLENLAGKLHLWRRQSCLRARLTQVRPRTCLPWEQALKPYTQSVLRPEKKGDHQIGSAKGAFSSVAWGHRPRHSIATKTSAESAIHSPTMQ